MTKVAVILTFDVTHPDQVPDIITEIDPPSLPFFDGNARITTEPHVAELIRWLDA